MCYKFESAESMKQVNPEIGFSSSIDPVSTKKGAMSLTIFWDLLLMAKYRRLSLVCFDLCRVTLFLTISHFCRIAYAASKWPVRIAAWIGVSSVSYCTFPFG